MAAEPSVIFFGGFLSGMMFAYSGLTGFSAGFLSALFLAQKFGEAGLLKCLAEIKNVVHHSS
jgi:hypothetical protein